MLNKIKSFFAFLFEDSFTSERKAMERYLSKAQNIYELEERQRAWNRNRSFF